MNITAIEEKCAQDSAFLALLCESETIEEIIQVCDKNNLNITQDEASGLLTGFKKAKEYNSSDDLSEDDLDTVSGGFAITTTTVVLAGIGIYAAYKGGEKLGQWIGNKRCKWFGY